VPPLLFTLDNLPEVGSRAAVLIDAHTGAILYAKNPEDQIPPASLAKLVSMHIMMNEINAGRASYDDIVPITTESWAQSQPRRSSLMFLEPGHVVTLREIMLGLAVPSGNDAAVAAALHFAPSVKDFVNLMNFQVIQMGLKVTHFADVSGYSNQNITTANEFAYFCYHYVKLHPQSLNDFHSVRELSYPLEHNISEEIRNNTRTITQENNNRLLWFFSGTDGLKTGFIPDAGYNIALTAQRDNTRFILVILGAPYDRTGLRIRADDSYRLLSWAFRNFKTVRVDDIEQLTAAKKDSLLTVRLWKGKERNAQLKLAGYTDFTTLIDRAETLFYRTETIGNVVAPLSEDTLVAYLVISDDYGELHRVPLVTTKAYERGNIFKRFWHSIRLLFMR